MTVALIGAGPGDPGLLTLRGAALLGEAEVIVHDRLIPPELLDLAPADAELIDVGKAPGASTPQREIIDTLIELGRSGRRVVRLKGGDPFVFGRGAEESEALRRAGVAVEVIPGVTAAIAAPAAAGIPVTDRRFASAFAVAAGHECEGESDLDWAALARIPTLVFLMGLRGLPRITAELLGHGAAPETPAAVIENATLPSQRTVVGTLATIADLAARVGLEPPATLVVGDVVRVPDALARLPHTPVADAARSAVLIDA